jgi:hypothetical protein
MAITRNGKIARLPKAIRDRLNQQILDGVPGKDLVRWLNGLDDVVDTLVRHFNATRVTEQNLSEWKQGGYQDWLKQQEQRDWVRRLSEEAEDVVEDSGVMPWMERVGAMFEIKLGKVVEALQQQQVETPEQMAGLIQLSRELARHRHLSQEAARWRKEELRRLERENPQDPDERIGRARNKALFHYLKLGNHNSMLRQMTEKMSPEKRERFEKELDQKALEYLMGPESPGFADPVEDEEAVITGVGATGTPTESDSIRPDPTSFSPET